MTLGLEIARAIVSSGAQPAPLHNSIEEFVAYLSKKNAGGAVFTNERPSIDTVEHLRALDIPIIVLVTTPSAAVTYLHNERKLTPIDAMRQTSISLAVLDGLARSNRTLLLSDAAPELTIANASLAIARHLRRDQLVEALRKHESVDGNRALFAESVALSAKFTSTVPEADRQIIEQCLAGFAAMRYGETATRFDWPVNALMTLDQPDTPITGPVEMLGSARTLIYGPYLGLPQGNWRADVRFRVHDNHSGNTLHVDVTSKGFLGRAAGVLPAEAVLSCSIDFEVIDPTLPHEVRFTTQQGAIEGEIELLDIRIQSR